MSARSANSPSEALWDHSSDLSFVAYYEQESASEETIQRFTLVRDKALKLLAARDRASTSLKVVDIGCGAGTQSRIWAMLGHLVYGLDVNAHLVELARRRACENGLEIVFEVGTATQLPYSDSSMDIALLPELLEHVANWQDCLKEAMRILKPGGMLFLSTTNWLCPIQQEYTLPMYSWYPGFLKRKYERLAITTRPEIANHCTYPAVNWFSFYSLANYLNERGFHCMDRFDSVETDGKGLLRRIVVNLIRRIPLLRFCGHVLTPGSIIFAVKV